MLLLALLFGGATAGGLFAQETPPLEPYTATLASSQPSEEGAPFLLLPNGAQGVGLGRAMTALASSESAFWNPAGLAALDGSRLILTRGEHLAGDAIGFSAVWAREDAGAMGASYQLLDAGTQDRTDRDGNVLGSITIRNHQALISGAASIGNRLRVGGSAKVVQSRATCRGRDCGEVEAGVTATAYAADLGLQVRPLRDRPLDVGFMLAHLGPSFRVRNAEQADPLPARIRAGASYDVLDGLLDEDLVMNLVVEVEDRLRDPGNPTAYFGGEFIAGAADQVFIRGGYVLGDRTQTDGAALGFGVRYERFEFGLARSLARGGPTEGDEPIHLTLGLIL